MGDAPSSARRPLRVLMAVPRYPYPVVGGLERQAHQLALQLAHHGIQVSAVSGATNPSRTGREEVDGIPVERLPLSGGPRDAAVLIGHLLRTRRDYDIVHLHNLSGFGAAVTVAAGLAKRPLLSKLPGFGNHGIPGMSPLRVGLLKRSDGIVAMTPESLDELRAVGFPRSRVLSVTNGIEASAFVRPKIWKSRHVEIGFVGRLIEGKGLLDLFDAWTAMSAYGPSRLHIFGSGPQEPEIQKQIAARGLQDTVLLRGYVEDMGAALAELDMLVLPSYAEGNSNAVLEAMAAGLPVVSTQLGGTSMLVGPEGAPYLVRPGDTQALAKVMGELVADRAKREALGKKMSRRIAQRFGIAVVGNIYAQAYRLLAGGHRERIGDLNAGGEA